MGVASRGDLSPGRVQRRKRGVAPLAAREVVEEDCK